jgi:hypothetical protein
MRLRGYEVSIDSTKVPPRSVIPQQAYRFEILDYAQRWLADQRMMQSMHFGLGYLPSDTAGRREFYQGDAWLGSVRTTSGEFAYLNGEPLLPSDCVSYTPVDTGRRVFLQVFGIGYFGHPDDGIPQDTKQLGILARRLLPPWDLPVPWDWKRDVSRYNDIVEDSDHPSHLNAPFEPADTMLPELVLMEDDRLVFPLQQLERKEWVFFLDYPSVDGLQQSLLPTNPTHCVRHIAYSCDGPKIRSVCQRHRIPAELELLDMGRQHILDTFVGQGRISLPFTLFLDAFGLHRNVYHQLQGLYIQPANLDVAARFTMQNCFVLMLGPFGGNDSDIAGCLQDETVLLGRGVRTNIISSDGSVQNNAVLTVFPLCMSGDMPQQNHNVGVMSPAANYNCRYCFTGDRGNLALDTRAEGRYQTAHSYLRDQLELIPGKKTKAQLFSRCGINEAEGPIFAQCFPCLDIFNGYPSDPFHCELRLAKYFQEVLIGSLLSEEGKAAYGAVWNQIDVPYGWLVISMKVEHYTNVYRGRPQNPVGHKGSMQFSENGRLALLNPFALMMLFGYHEGTDGQHTDYLIRGRAEAIQQAYDIDNGSPLDAILQTAFAMAQVIHLTIKPELSSEEYAAFPGVIKNERRLLQCFFRAAGKETRAEVPNIHVSMHYMQDLLNYGTLYNHSTMIGEQKHKVHKAHAPHTNSNDRVLQLLKAVNLSQTMRFMLDGNFPNNTIALLLNEIVSQCPVLRNKFIGSTTFTEPKPGNIAVEPGKSLFARARVGKHISSRKLDKAVKLEDCNAIIAAWQTLYGDQLFIRMRLCFEYWAKMTGIRNESNHTRKVAVRIGGFVAKQSVQASFYRVVRIVTLTISGHTRCFLICTEMVRDMEAELTCAPYDIFREGSNRTHVLSIEEIVPENMHVLKRNATSWWWNPYVNHFL